MRFVALDSAGNTVLESVFYAIGEVEIQERDGVLPHEFDSGAELLAICAETGEPISEIMLRGELTLRSREAVFSELVHIWHVMQECIKTGCQRTGIMSGVLALYSRKTLPSVVLRWVARARSEFIPTPDFLSEPGGANQYELKQRFPK